MCGVDHWDSIGFVVINRAFQWTLNVLIWLGSHFFLVAHMPCR